MIQIDGKAAGNINKLIFMIIDTISEKESSILGICQY